MTFEKLSQFFSLFICFKSNHMFHMQFGTNKHSLTFLQRLQIAVRPSGSAILSAFENGYSCLCQVIGPNGAGNHAITCSNRLTVSKGGPKNLDRDQSTYVEAKYKVRRLPEVQRSKRGFSRSPRHCLYIWTGVQRYASMGKYLKDWNNNRTRNKPLQKSTDSKNKSE